MKHASPRDETRRDLRRARARHVAACLRPPHDITQDAFVRIDAQPCSWTELVRDSCSLTRPSSTPFQITRANLPCPGRAAAPSYPAPSWLASRLTSTALERCFSPTSATDTSIRAPDVRSTPEPATFAAKTAFAMCRSVSPDAIRSAASDHLAVIRAPGGSAFDDAYPASDEPPTSPLLMRRRRAPRAGRATLSRRYQP